MSDNSTELDGLQASLEKLVHHREKSKIKGLNLVPISICFVPTFFITSYTCFKKVRIKIFNVLFKKKVC